MIRPAQLKLLKRARVAAAPDPAEFADILRRHGGADRVEALTAAGYARVMDQMTVAGFRCRQRPILSARTRQLICETCEALQLSDHTYEAELRFYGGVADLRDLSGLGLIGLLTRWERRGLDVAYFREVRRDITPKQLRLVQVAREQATTEEDRYYRTLQTFGGVITASDLDQRGFDLVMALLEGEGFERRPATSTAPAFGHRPGFASPAQVELIRALWRECSGTDAEAELNAWLERYHGASSLRFVTTAKAGKIIIALKAMKARTPKKLHDEKEQITPKA